MLPPPSILGFSRGVAQTEARRVWDAEVGGSSPPTPTVFTAELRSPQWGSFKGKRHKGVANPVPRSPFILVVSFRGFWLFPTIL
jgi:hypothetical protein